jgi:hypothetical protein
MTLTPARALAIALWSALSLVLWMVLVRLLTPTFYKAFGSPAEATLSWWAALLLPPLLLGLLSGAVLLRIGRAAPRPALAIYWIALLLLTLLIGLVAGAPATVLALLNGKTSWAYFVGSCLLPIAAGSRARPAASPAADHS